MKKFVLTMIAALAMTAAMAQTSDNKERKAPKQMTPEEMTERMTKELKLDEAQKSKVLDLNTAYKDVLGRPGMGRGPRGPHPDGESSASAQAPEAKQQGEHPKRRELTEEQKAKMKEVMEQRKAYNEKLKQILTEEQWKTYQKHQHRGHHGKRHGMGRPNKNAEQK